MTGNTRSGHFSGLILGTYEISGSVATVTIATKPGLVSWAYIERQLREFLGG